MSNYYWLLDPGHGGIIDGVYQTPGKRGPKLLDGRQVFEGDTNRKIVRQISLFLDQKKIDYRVIVPELEDISLADRVRRVNEAFRANPSSILVSVHCNAGGGTGWEVYTSPGYTKSDKIAEYFFKSAERTFPEFRMRRGTVPGQNNKEADFYVLTRSICPAILTENFFMDTLIPDGELLLSEGGLLRIAAMHVDAILKIELERPI